MHIKSRSKSVKCIRDITPASGWRAKSGRGLSNSELCINTRQGCGNCDVADLRKLNIKVVKHFFVSVSDKYFLYSCSIVFESHCVQTFFLYIFP